jgi:NitT/TauT family transport system ATP-binding protein
MAEAIRVDGLRVAYGELEALRNIELSVADGEFVCLLGPSGCGKSTLLNAVAGFVKPTAGRVLVQGKPVAAPGPDRAMVFQEYALFPWMTVAENVAFGLEIRKLPRARIDAIVDGLLRKLSLADFRDRFPKELSGGMRQRVAIARALALDAPTLLFDEPFGALDALTRRSLQEELLRIWSELRKTALFVTHSIEESIFLADRVVVMTYRPGTVKRVVPIALQRPRDPQLPAFAAIARQLTDLVMEEQRLHQTDELHR